MSLRSTSPNASPSEVNSTEPFLSGYSVSAILMVGTAPLSVQRAVSELSENSNELEYTSPSKMSQTPSLLFYKSYYAAHS